MISATHAGPTHDDKPSFWADHLHPDDLHVVTACHNETLACKDHELVYRMLAADGRTVYLRNYVNVHSVDGIPVELFGVMIDITRERELEAAARMSDIGQIAASLAHEFNNVLMGIQPFVEIIDNAGADPRIASAVDHISRAISRGKRASRDVLRFANPTEPRLDVIEAAGWLRTVLTDVVALLPDTVSLVSAIEPNLGRIRCDREQLEQVMTNLVINARDAMGLHGTITVAANHDGHFVRFSVLDDGCGVPEALLERIFDPLVTTKRNGTGLGLPIARRLVESHGGKLHAENRGGGGAAFHFSIPSAGLVAGERLDIAPIPITKVPAVTRVLLIEDDTMVGAGIAAMLSQAGFESAWVRSAANACDTARRTRPDIALIDINLPDGNGIDLIPQLRAVNPQLPIIISTGHVEPGSVPGCGILSLLKPYTSEDLLTAIARVVAEIKDTAAA